jgi:nitrogen PTS system EIIA component
MSWYKKPAASEDHLREAEKNGSRISGILAPGAIKVNMEAADREEAFEELVDVLVQTGGVTDREAALNAVRKREEMGSTCIGEGIAVPHGKDETVRELVASLGLSQKGIAFGGVDGKPAKAVFLLLAQPNHPGPHVQALASFAQLTQSPQFVRELLEAKSSTDVLDVIRKMEARE